MQTNFDTICAMATPLSTGAVGVIRLSGERAFEIAQKIFSKKIEAKKINHGYVIENGEKIDEIVLLAFVSPHSFTGEDVIEFQTHGSPVVCLQIIKLLLKNGARMANRGEFSLRAFLNHKIDMTQAEAILDIINAKTEKFAKNSLQNLAGALHAEISKIKDEIKQILAKIIASLDFPEDVREVSQDEIMTSLERAKAKIVEILKSASVHNVMRQGVEIAILGNVNVGKSSLFNALLNLDRAIVTDIAGTTRDVITESIDIKGICATLIDTAGIRQSEDEVEKIGIDNAKNYALCADLILCLFDGTIGKTQQDEAIFKDIEGSKPVIFVATKADIKKYEKSDAINISAITRAGIDELKEQIYKKIAGTSIETDFSTNIRQQECLNRAQKSLEFAIAAAARGELQDLISIDIKDSLLALDEITGEVLTDTLLDDIFSQFCIGK